MSLHQSLKTAGGLMKHRNVLSKRERILRLLEKGTWSEEDLHAFGLPKVRNIKVSKKSGDKKKEDAADEAAPAAAETPAQ